MHHARLATLAFIVILATAACSAASTAAPTAPPSVVPSAAAPSAAAPSASAPSAAAPSASALPAAAGSAVTVANFSFQPATITVPVGTTVTWTNTDSAGHTVAADDGSFTSGTLGTGAMFGQTFSTAGTFAYHCSIHASMTGTVVVQ